MELNFSVRENHLSESANLALFFLDNTAERLLMLGSTCLSQVIVSLMLSRQYKQP